MKINEQKVARVINECIEILNKDEHTEQEVIVILAQLLIKVGITFYDPDNTKLSKGINWLDLNKEYYTKPDASIGLGLMLNGGSLMGALGLKANEDFNNFNVDGEKQNAKVPNITKNAQEISRNATKSGKTRRSNRRAR